MPGVGSIHGSLLCVGPSAGALIHVYKLQGSFVWPVFVGDVGSWVCRQRWTTSNERKSFMSTRTSRILPISNAKRLSVSYTVHPSGRGGLIHQCWLASCKQKSIQGWHLFKPAGSPWLFLADRSTAHKNVFPGITGFPISTVRAPLRGAERFVNVASHTHAQFGLGFLPGGSLFRVQDVNPSLTLWARGSLLGVNVDVGILLAKFWFAFGILLKLSPAFMTQLFSEESSVFYRCRRGL